MSSPVYKTPEDILRATIDSILNQTFTDFELIIVDDSPDPAETGKIVRSYDDKRIRYYANEKNIGMSKTCDKMVSLASGEYLANCNHDDISVPTRFEQEVKVLDEMPDVGVVSGQLHSMHSGAVSKHPVTNKEIKAALLLQGCVIAYPAVMMRKSVLIENNIRFDENASPCEDYKLWIDLIDKTLFHNIGSVVMEYRDRADNVSHRQSEKMDEKAREIKYAAQRKYDWLLKECSVQRRIYLFGIPVLKTVRTEKAMTVFLFEFLPVLKIKTKRMLK